MKQQWRSRKRTSNKDTEHNKDVNNNNNDHNHNNHNKNMISRKKKNMSKRNEQRDSINRHSSGKISKQNEMKNKLRKKDGKNILKSETKGTKRDDFTQDFNEFKKYLEGKGEVKIMEKHPNRPYVLYTKDSSFIPTAIDLVKRSYILEHGVSSEGNLQEEMNREKQANLDHKKSRSRFVIGLDCEFHKEYAATMQISAGNIACCFHLTHIKTCPPEIYELLRDPMVKKVGKDVTKEDIECLNRTYKSLKLDAKTCGFIDVDVLAPGMKEVGLKVLTKRIAEVPIPRRDSAGGWANNELRDDQINYACMDAFAGYAIAMKLYEPFSTDYNFYEWIEHCSRNTGNNFPPAIQEKTTNLSDEISTRDDTPADTSDQQHMKFSQHMEESSKTMDDLLLQISH